MTDRQPPGARPEEIRARISSRPPYTHSFGPV